MIDDLIVKEILYEARSLQYSLDLIEEEVFRQANYDAKDEPETLDTIANLLHILLVPMNESIESITNLKKSAEFQINKKDIHIMHASTGRAITDIRERIEIIQ